MFISPRIITAATIIGILTLLPQTTFARQTPDLESLLSQLRTKAAEYRASIPSFFCDERVTSQELDSGKIKREIRIVSVFRILSPGPDDKGDPTESRQTKLLNEKPLTKEKKINPPYWFRGGFQSVGIPIPSLDDCYIYHLSTDIDNSAMLLLTISAKPPAELNKNCRGVQGGTTTMRVDSSSMQIVHIEHVKTFLENKNASSTAFTVDLSPVVLGEKIFWMPATVKSEIVFSRDQHTTGHFEAVYSNYHKLSVTSTVLPATGDTTQTTLPQ
jgi:hypothetical protein